MPLIVPVFQQCYWCDAYGHGHYMRKTKPSLPLKSDSCRDDMADPVDVHVDTASIKARLQQHCTCAMPCIPILHLLDKAHRTPINICSSMLGFGFILYPFG